MDVQKTEIIRRFTEWLAGPYGAHFEYIAEGYYTAIIRVQKAGAFDYLYCQRNYRGTSIERDDKFEYAGTYYKTDGQIYDVKSEISYLMAEDDEYETRSLKSLSKRLEFHVCRSVEKRVNNDRGNLLITELHSEREIRGMEYFKIYTAAKQARKMFLENDNEDGDNDFSFIYECSYEPSRWTEDSVLSYILDPDGYSEAEAMAFFDKHQEDILSDFLQSDFLADEYNNLINNPQHPVHRVKRIMQAMKSSSAKMVNVTVCINGIEFTFKVGASDFRYDCVNYYSAGNIAAADRQEFRRIYGRGSNYKPEDILRIEYARKILYSADTIN